MSAHVGIHRQKGLTAVILVLGLVLVTGCGGGGEKRIYQPNPSGQVGQPMPLKIAVIELEDRSPGTGFTNWNTFGALTPGYLYWTEFQKYHQTHFGKCLAAELKESHLFEVVDYHPDWERVSYGFRSYDLIVTGRLHQDTFVHTMYAYGLACSPCWLLGLPSASNTREADFEVTAFKSLEPDRETFTHRIKFHDSKIDGLFTSHRKTDFPSIRGVVQGFDLSSYPEFDTDFCPTELLRPHFLALRNGLAEALKRDAAEQGESALTQETKERKKQ